MRFAIKEKDPHQYFAIIPRYCTGCGKYFFLEKGRRYWCGIFSNPTIAKHFGPVNYYCKKCTEKRNISRWSAEATEEGE